MKTRETMSQCQYTSILLFFSYMYERVTISCNSIVVRHMCRLYVEKKTRQVSERESTTQNISHNKKEILR